MVLGDKIILRYFDRIAKDFDNIYSNRGNLVGKFINKAFRQGMYERAVITVQECGNVGNKSILDIGCGSGRIALPLAKKGAKVTGIDYSPRMIEMANAYLKELNATVNAEFLCTDFMEDFPDNQSFDITLALGVLDYIKSPLPFLNKMKSLTEEKMVVSYPAMLTLQMPIRKVWLWTRGCPVYFYSKKRLTKIYKRLGINSYQIISMPTKARVATDYLVISSGLKAD